MATVLEPRSDRTESLTVGDVMNRFGAIPLWRICADPPAGAATEADVLRIQASEGRLCELIDGILVEKTVGYDESLLACAIIELLRRFVRPRRLGLIAGEAGTLKFAPGLIYIPDVSFISTARLPAGKRSREAIPHMAPDLAVEVLSPSNTPQEVQRKLAAYFKYGVRLVWLVDPRQRTVEVFTGPRRRTLLKETHTLTGGDVLPGFEVELRDLFAELDET